MRLCVIVFFSRKVFNNIMAERSDILVKYDLDLDLRETCVAWSSQETSAEIADLVACRMTMRKSTTFDTIYTRIY